MSDVKILNGFSELANMGNVKSGIDIYELEKKFMASNTPPKKDINDRFKEEMENISKELGMSDELTKPAEEPAPAAENPEIFSPAKATPIRSPPPNIVKNDNIFTEEEPVEKEIQNITQEQQRRGHIQNVMSSISGTGYSFEEEKKEDIKSLMLEEIDSLRSSLADDRIDISRVPEVDQTSPFEKVESVLKILRHKNDRNRYCMLAEEFILLGAHGLEELFDGKRTWFGKYKFDLRGWHSRVNLKLRRMRHDTSDMIRHVMSDFNIGPMARLMLELVPNAIMYSKMKQDQQADSANADFSRAFEQLRDV